MAGAWQEKVMEMGDSIGRDAHTLVRHVHIGQLTDQAIVGAALRLQVLDQRYVLGVNSFLLLRPVHCVLNQHRLPFQRLNCAPDFWVIDLNPAFLQCTFRCQNATFAARKCVLDAL
jgi:hypothetical protein